MPRYDTVFLSVLCFLVSVIIPLSTISSFIYLISARSYSILISLPLFKNALSLLFLFHLDPKLGVH